MASCALPAGSQRFARSVEEWTRIASASERNLRLRLRVHSSAERRPKAGATQPVPTNSHPILRASVPPCLRVDAVDLCRASRSDASSYPVLSRSSRAPVEFSVAQKSARRPNRQAPRRRQRGPGEQPREVDHVEPIRQVPRLDLQTEPAPRRFRHDNPGRDVERERGADAAGLEVDAIDDPRPELLDRLLRIVVEVFERQTAPVPSRRPRPTRTAPIDTPRGHGRYAADPA